ncbi:MAG: heparinase II/III family protein [Bacteroidales bacterium]
MRNHLGIKILFFVLFGIASNLFAAQKVSCRAVLPGHPRIFMSAGMEKQIRRHIRKDADWLRLHTLILDEARQIQTLPMPERTMIGKRLLVTAREELRRIMFLGYAYRMTGEKALADRIEKELLAIAAFSDWNPSHFLDVAEMTVAVSVGYDWTYDVLSATSKEQIRQAIITKGLQPSFPPSGDNHPFATRVNNWNQVCNTGMSVGALAVFEHYRDSAAVVLDRAIRTLPLAMSGYAPDGAYPEGISYWEYGTTYTTCLLDLLQKNMHSDFGLSQLSGFMETGLYAQQMITPALNTFNYCDNFSVPDFLPASFWFYKQDRNPALIYVQQQILRAANAADLCRNRFLPLALIWATESNALFRNLQVPEILAWKGEGKNPVAVFRSGWENPEDLYLGMKVGSANIDHGHQDIGSFLFEADGVRWALDLGQEDYTNLEKAGLQLWGRQRWDIFRHHNFTHNIITINDKLQDYKGRADFDSFSADPCNMYASADLTGQHSNWVKRLHRQVALLDKEYVCITV